MPLYKRVLLKLSGEVLAGSRQYGFDPKIVDFVASEIAETYSLGIEIAIVIGGGNILRGATTEGISRTSADTMGMLATVINSIYLSEALNEKKVKAKVLTSLHIDRAGELFTPEYARELLKDGYVVIIGGGTGNPFFTTDTAAALRCAEVGADVFLKATKVDGIYDS
ncbi:MAG: UMP kinase, partial [Chitinispirillaceae bacterium]|nr:UMP kinase [Chitinispirillaceae bacterium]